MGGWGEYTAAWTVFLLTHAIPVRPPAKPWIVMRLGTAGFAFAYSVLSIAVLIWLVCSADRAPFVEVWSRAEWQNHIVLVAMTLACFVLALAAFRPNPFSFGGWDNAKFDPARPGIVGWVRHPVLVALCLWSIGHLAPNGDLAHVIMFGGFAFFALLGMAMIDRRRKRSMGPQMWHRLRPLPNFQDVWSPLRCLAAVFVLLGLLVLHPLVIGVPAYW